MFASPVTFASCVAISSDGGGVKDRWSSTSAYPSNWSAVVKPNNDPSPSNTGSVAGNGGGPAMDGSSTGGT